MLFSGNGIITSLMLGTLVAVTIVASKIFANKELKKPAVHSNPNNNLGLRTEKGLQELKKSTNRLNEPKVDVQNESKFNASNLIKNRIEIENLLNLHAPDTPFFHPEKLIAIEDKVGWVIETDDWESFRLTLYEADLPTITMPLEIEFYKQVQQKIIEKKSFIKNHSCNLNYFKTFQYPVVEDLPNAPPGASINWLLQQCNHLELASCAENIEAFVKKYNDSKMESNLRKKVLLSISILQNLEPEIQKEYIYEFAKLQGICFLFIKDRINEIYDRLNGKVLQENTLTPLQKILVDFTSSHFTYTNSQVAAAAHLTMLQDKPHMSDQTIHYSNFALNALKRKDYALPPALEAYEDEYAIVGAMGFMTDGYKKNKNIEELAAKSAVRMFEKKIAENILVEFTQFMNSHINKSRVSGDIYDALVDYVIDNDLSSDARQILENMKQTHSQERDKLKNSYDERKILEDKQSKEFAELKLLLAKPVIQAQGYFLLIGEDQTNALLTGQGAIALGKQIGLLCINR